jgi:hypothetical protein
MPAPRPGNLLLVPSGFIVHWELPSVRGRVDIQYFGRVGCTVLEFYNNLYMVARETE